MSIVNLIKDLVSGNITNVEARLKDWWSGLSKGLQATLTVIETNEGKILQGLVPLAAADVIKNGFNTASFVAAGLDVGKQLLSQNITMANTVIFTALNAEVNSQAAAAGIPVPTNAGVQVVAPIVVPTVPAS